MPNTPNASTPLIVKNTQNKIDGNITGGASNADENKKDINFLDKIQEFAYENGLHNLFPMSSDATINGMHDMEAANKDKNATVLDNLDAVNNSRNKAYLKSMGAKEQDKGVIYDEHSAVAINFKNSPELNMHIAEIRDDVINNRPLKDKK